MSEIIAILEDGREEPLTAHANDVLARAAENEDMDATARTFAAQTKILSASIAAAPADGLVMFNAQCTCGCLETYPAYVAQAAMTEDAILNAVLVANNFRIYAHHLDARKRAKRTPDIASIPFRGTVH